MSQILQGFRQPAHYFSRRWIVATLLVLAGTALCVRLGFWQLDRLEQRRAFNERVTKQQSQPVLVLEAEVLRDGGLVERLTQMEYRSVRVTGEYDFERQVALRNQVYGNFSGLHLITPLKIQGTDQVVLVDRGWIPAEDFAPQNWRKYDEGGIQSIAGVVRVGQSQPDFGRIADPTPAEGEWLDTWNLANIAAMAQQLPYPILPIYIQQSPDTFWMSLPHRSAPDLELTEGPHLGYAIQWFTFAALLFFGYPFFVRREEARVTES
jgi:surfeit locus 1 family protein